MRNSKSLAIAGGIAAIFVVFLFYIWGITTNPPGFYVDECALAYNASLVSQTGAGESGTVLPIYFEVFKDGFRQYVSPTQVYLLAAAFLVFPESILTARIFGAFWVFLACLLLGFLAYRLCRDAVPNPSESTVRRSLMVGVSVAALAIATPWLFELSRLVLEVHSLPLAVVLFLLAVYYFVRTDAWTWRNVLAIAASLTFLTYCYTSGRILGLALGAGLFLFATSRRRLIAIVSALGLYGLTLIPIVVFNRRNPDSMMRRLYEISYIKPWTPWSEIFPKFVTRYLEDQSLLGLLVNGDHHSRHHVQGSGGAIFYVAIVLVVVSLILLISRSRQNRFWMFVVYGAAVSIIPGALTVEPLHALRNAALPVFLLALTIPAFHWLFIGDPPTDPLAAPRPQRWKSLVLAGLLLVGIYETVSFQIVYRSEGWKRDFDFNVTYKAAYDQAVAQESRPIYLEDGYWGPGYVHALWYATVEGRPTSEFKHLGPGEKAPPGSIVISTEQYCQNCDEINRYGAYMLYRTK